MLIWSFAMLHLNDLPSFNKFHRMKVLLYLPSSKSFPVNIYLSKVNNRKTTKKVTENCAFPQNFHTMKFVEITVFYAVLAENGA